MVKPNIWAWHLNPYTIDLVAICERYLAVHQQKHHTPFDVKVQPVECVEDLGSLKKESAWIKVLRTTEPYGLNITP